MVVVRDQWEGGGCSELDAVSEKRKYVVDRNMAYDYCVYIM